MPLLETASSAYPDDTELDQLRIQVHSRVGCSLDFFEIEDHPDGLILRGRARRYYDKQMAQVVAYQLSGLLILANDIEVA